jgi:hypothetical protein
VKIHWVSRANSFICERKNFILNSFIYIEPRKIFRYMSDMMKLRSLSDSTNGRIKNRLKIRVDCLSGWKIEWKRLAIVKFRMSKRGGYGARCGTIDGVTDASEISNVIQA